LTELQFVEVPASVGSIARCASPTFLKDCTSEAPLARTHRQLHPDQRRALFRLVEACTPVGEIGTRLGRHPSTIYCELGRNRFRDGDRGFCGYFPLTAQDLARRHRQRRRKLAADDGLREYVAERLREAGRRSIQDGSAPPHPGTIPQTAPSTRVRMARVHRKVPDFGQSGPL